MKPFVRTTLGDIAPSDLGVCYAHEHVVIDQSVALKRFPEYDLRHVDTIVAELQTLRAAGVRTMVDAMPGGGAGRQVRKLAEASTRSGMQILCPTGLHLAKYYPDDHWSQSIPEKDLADVFISEITDGIDANDLATGTIARTAHRAGLIKVASGCGRLSDHETKCFRAAAAAHVRTGAPILTHTEQGTAAFEQIEIFRAGGVDLSHVVLSHCDGKPDVAYHREILSTGVKLEYDSAFRWKPGQGNPTRDLVAALCDSFPTQILLGMDAARPTYWQSFGGAPGLDYLITTFVPMLLAAGVSRRAIDRIFIDNPAEAYSFRSES